MSVAKPTPGEQDGKAVRTGKGMDTGAPSQTEPKFDPKDPYTLLCERCGYVIADLDREGVCPECGKPISESLPGARAGTPWQRKPTTKNLMKTWWSTLRFPNQTLDKIRFEDASGDRHTAVSLGVIQIISLLIVAVVIVVEAGHKGIVPLVFISGIFMFGWLICALIGAVEALLALIFAHVYTRRMDSQRIMILAGHAAVGWVMMWIFVTAGSIIILLFVPPVIHPDLYGTPRMQRIRVLESIAMRLIWIGIIGGMLYRLGFMLYGSYLCRYMNRPGPTDG